MLGMEAFINNIETYLVSLKNTLNNITFIWQPTDVTTSKLLN